MWPANTHEQMFKCLSSLVISQAVTEKEMATHSSILAWRLPWTEEPGGLQSVGSMGSHRVRHALATEHTHTGSQLSNVAFPPQIHVIRNIFLNEFWLNNLLSLT